jgi:hypothetical protein
MEGGGSMDATGEGATSPRGAPPLASLERARATCRLAEAVPLAAYEELEGAAVLGLVDESRALLDDASLVVGALLEHYDGLSERRASLPDVEPAPTSTALFGALERSMEQDPGIKKVQNLAFVARFGLRRRAAALAELAADAGKWELIDAASSALREIGKALGAVDLAVCQLEGLPEPCTFYVTELERSLSIRHAYRIFHHEVARDVPGLDCSARLRRAANAIAKLVGRPVYPSMRVHDRFMLRTVQKKLHAWLATGGGSNGSGPRLVEDVVHVAELMLKVGERAELRAHDAELALSVAGQLEAERLSLVEARVRLAALQGRDAALDSLLGTEPPIPVLLAKLREVAERLVPTPVASATTRSDRPKPAALDGDSI